MANFLVNVLKLVSGSVLAQALGILLIPIITRIYSPDDFGVLQLFTAISGIVAALSCLSYQLSIMLPKKDEDAANIVVLCVILIVITSAISGIISIFFADQIGQVLNTPQISNYLIFLSPVIFLNGLFFVMNYWLSRKLRYGTIAYSRVSNSAVSKLTQIGIGCAFASPLGLIFGLVVGYVTADFLMLRGGKNDLDSFKHVSAIKIKELSARYKDFPLFSSWSTVANSISTQTPSFMLAFFYGTAVVGQYGLANMAVNLPMGIVGAAIGQVFFQKASEQKNMVGSIKNVVSEVHKKLVSIGIFPMLVLMILSEEIFSFVFGAEWSIAGTYAKILIPWTFLVFISSPLSTLFSVLEKQKVGLSFNLTLLISRIIALYIGGRYGSPIFTLSLFSITGVVFWGWMNLYILKVSDVKFIEGICIFTKYATIAFVISLPVFITKYLSLSLHILIVSVGISTILYYMFIIYEDASLRSKLSHVIEGVKI